MIGNDIIDIELAKKSSRWKQSRFLNKLFSKREQQLIFASDDRFLMIWRLWSMKEAAYKLYTQLYPSRFYTPNKFECFVSGMRCKVTYQDFKCQVITETTSDYIMSEASLKRQPMTSQYVSIKRSDYKTQNHTLKEALLSSVSNQLRISKSELRISKSEFGIPCVYQNFIKLPISISISHDGCFGVYAIA